MEAIENVLDDWLIEKFIQRMGSGSSYGTSKLTQVQTAILRAPRDWEEWTFPALGISNRFTYRTAQQHMMTTQVTLDKSIVYLLTFVTYGTESAAITQNRTLTTRAEIELNWMRQNLGGLTNTYNETVQQLIYYKSSLAPDAGMSRMRKYIDPKNSGKWFVAQDISVVFTTTTGV